MPANQTRRPGRRRRSGARVDRRTRAARAQGREARDELLTAALRVFARRGYGQAGVNEIAAEAGYSKGALYWHFASKEEVLLALLEERINAPMREMVALLESAPPIATYPWRRRGSSPGSCATNARPCCSTASIGAS